MAGITIASQTIGFISFFFTLLTWAGVYLSLITTMRSAPRAIPIVLGNLRQEILMERSLIRHRLKQGDRFHCFPGRELRKVGPNQSHIRFMEQTLKVTWRNFRNIEKEFLVRNRASGDPEEVSSGDAASEVSEMDKRSSWQNEKSHAGARVRDAKSMRRRQSQIKSRMGTHAEAGLSIDGATYYSTGLGARFLWWWRRDDVSSLQQRVSVLQIRRMESDVFEIDALVKRGLEMLGGMSGEDPYYGFDNPKGGSGGGGGTGVRRRRSRRIKSRLGSAASGRKSRDHDSLQPGMREVYEKEIRRTRRSSRSGSSRSPSSPPSPSPPAKVAGITMSRGASRQPRSRAPSVVEYEIISPGRVWVDVEDNRSHAGDRRDSFVDRGGRPTPAASRQSYVRQRDYNPSR